MPGLFLTILAAALYIAASVLLLLTLSRSRPLASRSSMLLATGAMVIQALVVIQQTGLPHSLQLPLFVALNATALFVVALLLTLCISQAAHYLGLAVYPLAALFVLMSIAAPGSATSLSFNIQLHVLLSLVAYAFLTLAAAQAILVAVQRRQLQTHRPGGFMRALPALDETETLLFSLLTAGFAALSLSLASGFFYLDDMFAQSLVHKTTLSVLAWLIFGALLYARWRWGWLPPC